MYKLVPVVVGMVLFLSGIAVGDGVVTHNLVEVGVGALGIVVGAVFFPKVSVDA